MIPGLRKVATSAWAWALPLALGICLSLDQVGSRYTVDVTPSRLQAPLGFYADLNGDGESEMIQGRAGPPLNTFPVMTMGGEYFEQWNFAGQLIPEVSDPFVGDYDQDSYGEIYVFTFQSDSLLLNVSEFFEGGGLHKERLFITRVNLIEGHVNSTIHFIGFHDQNADGKQELYFSVTSGFSLWPRLCYYYDLQNEALATGPFTGINLNKPFFADLDGDGVPEILSSTDASGNYHTPTPYSDYSAWLMVFTDSLRLAFNPIEYRGFKGSVQTDVLGMAGRSLLTVLYNFSGSPDSLRQKPAVRTYLPSGELVSEKLLTDLGISGYAEGHVLGPEGRQRYLLISSTQAMVLDNDLSIERDTDREALAPRYTYIADVNQDGEEEILVTREDRAEIFILDARLEELGSFPLQTPWSLLKMSTTRDHRGAILLFVATDRESHLIALTEHPFFYLEYLVYPSVYLGLVFFISLIKRETTRQVEKRESLKRRLQTLQLQSIKGQLNPHFTFNALNSVASLLYLDDRKAAYDNLTQFTRMLRKMLADAERTYRPLEEELEFVRIYLDMEKLRFGDKFSYQIQTGHEVTGQEPVPVLCIQTFVENSIRHGLMPLEKGGKLSISAERSAAALLIRIDDNGVGRRRAAQLHPQAGRGLKMITDFFEILNQSSKEQATYTITDLAPRGTLTGTRVEVVLPLPAGNSLGP